MKRLLEIFAKSWQYLRDVVPVLLPCRFSAIVVAAGAALLLSAQGLEFTVRLPAEGPGKILWFYVCVFLWAFQSWYWARLMLDLTSGDRDAPPPELKRLLPLIKHTPRVLAAGSYLVALAGCLLAGRAAAWIGVRAAIQGVLFYSFLVIRRSKLVDKLVGVNPDGSPDWKQKLLLQRGADPTSLRSLPLLSRIILWLTLAAAAALTVWVCIDAVGFGWFFGAAAVPFLGFSMLVPAGSLLVLWARGGGAGRVAGGPLPPEDTGRGDPGRRACLPRAAVRRERRFRRQPRCSDVRDSRRSVLALGRDTGLPRKPDGPGTLRVCRTDRPLPGLPRARGRSAALPRPDAAVLPLWLSGSRQAPGTRLVARLGPSRLCGGC